MGDVPRPGGTKERLADDRGGGDMLKVMNEVEGKRGMTELLAHRHTHEWRQTIQPAPSLSSVGFSTCLTVRFQSTSRIPEQWVT
jgi:hypothetical protein